MRRKRSARKKKMRKRALYQAASLLSIAAFGIAQVTPSSHAVFSHTASIKDGQINASFVFPETIQTIIDEIKVEMEKVKEARDLANDIYDQLQQSTSSEEAMSANVIDPELQKARTSEEEVLKKVTELNNLYAQALLEVKEDESANKILKVIDDGLETATEHTDQIKEMIKEIEEMITQANVVVAGLILAETVAAEKLIITDIANKALLGLTDSQTLASEILAKYGQEFDIAQFQALTEELTKSEADLQKALEDAESIIQELKGYVEGTKQTASPEVLEEAKNNYEKVQAAIDSLKQTMESTKSTKSEVESKIEQEKQKQAEEAEKAQQEQENQNSDGAGKGEQPEAPRTDGEQPDPNAPPAEEGEQQPDPNAPPAEEGEQPDPNAPPAEEGEQPDPNAPPAEEGEQPARPEDEEQPDTDAPAPEEDNDDQDSTSDDGDNTETDTPSDNGNDADTNDSSEAENQSDSESSSSETAATETQSASSVDNSSSNYSDNESTSSSQATSMSVSTSRDTVASFKVVRKEQNIGTSVSDSKFYRRESEEDSIEETFEDLSEHAQSEIFLHNNINKVKINIRPYL